MICQKCKEEGKESRVQSSGAMSTLLASFPYYDEQGRYHSHNPNRVSNSYSCSNGHKFTITGRDKCPNPDCSYGNEEKSLVYHEF